MRLTKNVAEIDPDLVARDEEGKPYAVRYEAANAMLLNEFLKEHQRGDEQARLNQAQERTIAQLKSTIAQQKKDLESTLARQQEKFRR